MIAHLVYVICNACGAPASQPTDTAKSARLLVPLSWSRPVASNGFREDLCPKCARSGGSR